MNEPLEIVYDQGNTENHCPLSVKIFGWTLNRVIRNELGETESIILEKYGKFKEYKIVANKDKTVYLT